MTASRPNRLHLVQRFVERRWYAKSPGILLIFFPLELLYRFIIHRRRKKLQTRAYQSQIPVLIVGNICVGGTGKTPVLIRLVDHLQSLGMKVGVVSRGYGRQSTHLVEVDASSQADDVGDEPLEIYAATKSPLIVDTDRVRAVQALQEKYPLDVILCDDGMQHYALARDIEIAVMSSTRKFGNGHCLPVGPMREPKTRLKDVDYVLWNGGAQDESLVLSEAKSFTFNIQAKCWINVCTGESRSLDELELSDCVAFAGIGEPEKFFSSLETLGAHFSKRSRPDHHRYLPEDFAGLESKRILMTAKDAVKCRMLAPQDTWYLQVEAALDRVFLEGLANQIRDCMDKR